jgi:hypothetical protein
MEGTIARVPILTKKLRLSWFSLVKYGLAYSFSQVIPERLRINHRGRKNTERKTDSSGKTYLSLTFQQRMSACPKFRR